MNITSMKYNIIYYSVSILIQYQSSSLIYLTSINQLIIIRKKNINNEMTGIIIPIRFIINSSLFVCFFFVRIFAMSVKTDAGGRGGRGSGRQTPRQRRSDPSIRPDKPGGIRDESFDQFPGTHRNVANTYIYIFFKLINKKSEKKKKSETDPLRVEKEEEEGKEGRGRDPLLPPHHHPG